MIIYAEKTKYIKSRDCYQKNQCVSCCSPRLACVYGATSVVVEVFIRMRHEQHIQGYKPVIVQICLGKHLCISSCEQTSSDNEIMTTTTHQGLMISRWSSLCLDFTVLTVSYSVVTLRPPYVFRKNKAIAKVGNNRHLIDKYSATELIRDTNLSVQSKYSVIFAITLLLRTT